MDKAPKEYGRIDYTGCGRYEVIWYGPEFSPYYTGHRVATLPTYRAAVDDLQARIQEAKRHKVVSA